MFITRFGRKLDVDLIKSAHLSSGFTVYWFRKTKPIPTGFEYVVAVHNPQGNTEHYVTLASAQTASGYYFSWLCVYA